MSNNKLKNGKYIDYYEGGFIPVSYSPINPDDYSFASMERNGLWICWHENGQKKSQYLYSKVMKDGVCIRWLKGRDKVTARYVAYDTNYCIDSPRRRAEYI